MKKTLFIALMASFAVNAQVREKGSIEIQPFAGFSTSKLYTSDAITHKSIVSPYFGVNAEFYFNSKWSLRTGLEFMQIGSKNPRYFNSGWNNMEEVRYKETFTNIVLPIHATVHFGKKRNLYLNFGPTLTYGISYKTSDGTVDINDIEDRVYAGLGIGVGYKYPITETISLAADYQNFTRIPEFVDFGNETHYYFYGNSALSIKAIIHLGSKKEN